MGQFLREIFGHRIELPDGSHADCLSPEMMEQIGNAERKRQAGQAAETPPTVNGNPPRQLLLPDSGLES